MPRRPPAAALLLLTAAVLPASDAVFDASLLAPAEAQLFRFRGRTIQNRDTRSAAPEPAKPDPMAEYRPPGAPRIERTNRRYRPGFVSTRPADTLKLVDAALDRSEKRYLTVGLNSPWQILHGTLALRQDFKVRVNGEVVPALDWLSSGVVHQGKPLIEKTPHGGRCHPFTEPYAFEGHTNQFLAILSISGPDVTHEFRTPTGEVVTMGDMVREAQKSIDGKGEMTWTLWFLTHYLDPEAEWENKDGQFWSMERLVQMEARHSVEGAPCGGMHRLFALSLARNAYLAKHGRVRGAWLEADQRIKSYEQAAKSLQNRDGSLGNQWFKGRSDPNKLLDLELRLKTSGHTLEWLMVSVSEKDLYSPWIQRAVQAVSRDVIQSLGSEIECGAFYHALDALAFYKLRVTPPPKAEPSEQPQELAQNRTLEPVTEPITSPQIPQPPKQTAMADTAPEKSAASRGAGKSLSPENTSVDAPKVAGLPAPDRQEVAASKPGSDEHPTSAEGFLKPIETDATEPRDLLADIDTDASEAFEDEQVPMLTRLPEGIDDEAAPIATASEASADMDEEVFVEPLPVTPQLAESEPAKTDMGSAANGPKPDVAASQNTEQSPQRIDAAPPQKPSQTATEDAPVRQLSGFVLPKRVRPIVIPLGVPGNITDKPEEMTKPGDFRERPIQVPFAGAD